MTVYNRGLLTGTQASVLFHTLHKPSILQNTFLFVRLFLLWWYIISILIFHKWPNLHFQEKNCIVFILAVVLNVFYTMCVENREYFCNTFQSFSSVTLTTKVYTFSECTQPIHQIIKPEDNYYCTLLNL